VERLLAVWAPTLAAEDADGALERAYLALLDELIALCPFAEPVRPGLITLPLRAPSRFFGGEDVVLAHVAELAGRLVDAPLRLGVADGLFSAFAAARRGRVVPGGASEAFRRSLPIGALERRDLATTCRRLGLATVGSFADLTPARVAERFSRDALHAHRVARGEESELRGQRDPRLATRLAQLRGTAPLPPVQGGFFGDHLDADRRAEVVAHRVRRRLGPTGVVTAELRGGRAPQDRATLRAWPAPSAGIEPGGPWPGRLPAPSPAATLAHPVAVVLRDGAGRAVGVDHRGLLSATPCEMVLDDGRARPVEWFGGPWPTMERWWSTRRRRAYLQLLTPQGALLVFAERGGWWLAGIYD
jgi:hypothetical protein